MREYDKEMVDAYMAELGRLRNPARREQFEAELKRQGFTAPDGESLTDTFLSFARAASADALNHERGLFEKKWDDASLRDALAKKLNRGPREVGRMLDAIREAELADAVLERRLQHDFEKRPPLLPELDEHQAAAVADNEARRNVLRHNIEQASVTVSERPSAVEPPPVSDAGPAGASVPSLHDDLAAAFDKHRGAP